MPLQARHIQVEADQLAGLVEWTLHNAEKTAHRVCLLLEEQVLWRGHTALN